MEDRDEPLPALQDALTELAQDAGIDPDGLSDSDTIRAIRNKFDGLTRDLVETENERDRWVNLCTDWQEEYRLLKTGIFDVISQCESRSVVLKAEELKARDRNGNHKLVCNKCGHEVLGVSWSAYPGIRTVMHGNECIPLCPDCGGPAEFSVAPADSGGEKPAPKVEVYGRPECVFAYCSDPEVCKGKGRCKLAD